MRSRGHNTAAVREHERGDILESNIIVHVRASLARSHVRLQRYLNFKLIVVHVYGVLHGVLLVWWGVSNLSEKRSHSVAPSRLRLLLVRQGDSRVLERAPKRVSSRLVEEI